MFDILYALTVLAVIICGVAIFNFRPDFYTYDFRADELVITLAGLELRKISYRRLQKTGSVH